MTRVKPVIAAQKRKKSPPRRNGNGLRQMDTRTQFTSRVEPRQEQRRCNRGRRVERAPAFQADTGQGYGRGGTSHLPQVRQDRSEQVRERRGLRCEPAAGRDGGALRALRTGAGKATNKQFITVQTSGGNTFYIVIDYDKPTDEDGEQYHTYFLNMVDEADLLAAMQAAGGELPECSCADKCAVGAINTDCTVCAVNMSECQGKAPEPAPVVEPEPDPEPEQPKATGNGGMLLLALAVVVIGGGAGWYFKIYRPKKQRAAESEADYGGEYDGAEDYDETDPEDDGPPWDEDGEE